MHRFFVLMALLTLGNVTSAQTPPATSETKPREPITMESFAGRWNGYWSRSYKMRYTIRPLSPDTAIAVYEWEELPGAPLGRRGGIIKLEGDTLKSGVVEIRISAEGPQFADAVGNFSTKRTAKLVRCAAPEEFLNAEIAMATKVTIAEDIIDKPVASLVAYFALDHNLLLSAAKNASPSDRKALDERLVSIPAQKDVLLRDVIQRMCDKAGLTFNVVGSDFEMAIKK